jgi:predicted alpha/beta hydrolase family esterase
MIASSNDPYADIHYSQLCADAWGCSLVNIGERGHINAASGLGDWPQGRAWLKELIAMSMSAS